MKIATILFIVGLIMSPLIGLAQTASTQTSPATTVNSVQVSPVTTVNSVQASPTTAVTSVQVSPATAVTSAQGSIISPATAVTSPQTISTTVTSPQTTSVTVTSPQTTSVSSSLIKCGVNTFKVYDECGVGAYKNVYAQCYDGYETNLGAGETSCKSADTWNQYAKEACANRCSTEEGSNIVSKPLSTSVSASAPTLISTPTSDQATTQATTKAITSTSVPTSVAGSSGGGAASVSSTPTLIPLCYINDDLMQQYDLLIVELQKSESDQTKAEEITKQITALKQEIAKQQTECANTTSQPTSTTVSEPVPMLLALPIATENKPVAVSIDRCNEVTQWENKIAYYKKLSGSSDADLTNSGFSREEIDKILQELSLGLDQVRAQCGNQNGTIAVPATATTALAPIAETVKPVVVESGQEIIAYYKAELEKVASAKGAEKQIEELKTLRDEIDGLIANLIKSRTEVEAAELNTLVKEVKVSQGEIKADDIVVKTTGKKILVNVGASPVSVEPTASQVLIRDKGLEVKTDEVMIKENVLSVGGVDVKMSASETADKLNIAPKAIELKKENAKAVYMMKIDERRKLFGFIPLNIQKTVAADAENGNILSEHVPWYNFLTTK